MSTTISPAMANRWTQARVRLVKQDWPTPRRREAILMHLNSMPGLPITVQQLAGFANGFLGLTRHPEADRPLGWPKTASKVTRKRPENDPAIKGKPQAVLEGPRQPTDPPDTSHPHKPGRNVRVSRTGRTYEPMAGARRAYAGSIARFVSNEPHANRAAAELKSDHSAVIHGHSIFPLTLSTAETSPRLLVSGTHSPKLGTMVLKGPWRGMPVFQLTLEERATCPRSCGLWRACLPPETPVLTADLRWVPLGSVKVGQRLAAFEEESKDARYYRSTCIAEVEAVGTAKLPCYEIVTDRGTIIASDDHLWLRRRSRLSYKWHATKHLKEGDKLQYFGDPWQTDTSYDAGRLRGFVEGEGYCCLWGNQESRHPRSTQTRIGWSQRPTKLCSEIIDVAQELGFKTARYERMAGAACTEISHVDIVGGWKQNAEFLGRIRPTRMIEKAEELWVNHSTGGRGGLYATVQSVRFVGMREVVPIQTSTKTMIAGGFFTHNCYGNSMPKARRHVYSPQLVKRLGDELLNKAVEHPQGFVVRLHVLGDFPDRNYTDNWFRWMNTIPEIHVFGYTAHPVDSEIAQTIKLIGKTHPGRWMIRNSVTPDTAAGGMQATTIWRKPDTAVVSEGHVCPAMMHGPDGKPKTSACVTCGLCWHPSFAKQRIVFIGHGMHIKRGDERAEPRHPVTQALIDASSSEPPIPPKKSTAQLVIHVSGPLPEFISAPSNEAAKSYVGTGPAIEALGVIELIPTAPLPQPAPLKVAEPKRKPTPFTMRAMLIEDPNIAPALEQARRSSAGKLRTQWGE